MDVTIDDSGPYINPEMGPRYGGWGRGSILDGQPVKCKNSEDPVSTELLNGDVVFKKFNDQTATCYNKNTVQNLINFNPRDPETRGRLPRYLYRLADMEDPRDAEYRQKVENSPQYKEVTRLIQLYENGQASFEEVQEAQNRLSQAQMAYGPLERPYSDERFGMVPLIDLPPSQQEEQHHVTPATLPQRYTSYDMDTYDEQD